MPDIWARVRTPGLEVALGRVAYTDGGMDPGKTAIYCNHKFHWAPSTLRILIADDHEAVRKGVCAILSSRLNIEVCGEAVNGREAIEKAIELNPNLIILDVTMPILSGFDAARQIRKVLPKIPIVMLSMHDSKQLVDEAKKIGVNGYVSKSHAATVLLQAIDAVLSSQTFYPEPIRPIPGSDPL